jgi:hypothetical protein
MMTIRASVCATIPCRPTLSLVVRRVVSAISAPATDEELGDREARIYQDGYDDGYRDGYEQGIDAEVCEVCNDIH